VGTRDPWAEERKKLEAELARKMGRALGQQEKAVLDAIGWPPSHERLAQLPYEFYDVLTGDTTSFVEAILEENAQRIAGGIIATINVSLGGEVYKESVRAWAEAHAYELSKYLSDNTRQIVGDAITQYLETPGMTRAELEELLQPAFGAQRASTIAVTEVTSSITAGTRAAVEEAEAAGLSVREVWRTQDGGCDEICHPLEGTYRGDGWDAGPPADSHPNCACWTDLEWAHD
jgi:hypothetical protein